MAEGRSLVTADDARAAAVPAATITSPGATPSPTEKLCVICDDAPAAWALLPCGHRCLCSGCVVNYEDYSNCLCPLCRGAVERTWRIYD